MKLSRSLSNESSGSGDNSRSPEKGIKKKRSSEEDKKKSFLFDRSNAVRLIGECVSKDRSSLEDLKGIFFALQNGDSIDISSISNEGFNPRKKIRHLLKSFSVVSQQDSGEYKLNDINLDLFQEFSKCLLEAVSNAAPHDDHPPTSATTSTTADAKLVRGEWMTHGLPELAEETVAAEGLGGGESHLEPKTMSLMEMHASGAFKGRESEMKMAFKRAKPGTGEQWGVASATQQSSLKREDVDGDDGRFNPQRDLSVYKKANKSDLDAFVERNKEVKNRFSAPRKL